MRRARTPAVLLAAVALLLASAAVAQDRRLPLRDDSSAWLGVGGQLRIRSEGWNGFGFGAPAVTDDGFVLARLLYHGDLHVSRSLSLFAEVKSSLATNRTLPGGRRAGDEDVLDLQQLYAQAELPLAETRLTLRAGRADLRLGRERLVSPLDWANSRRVFQGASAQLAAAGFGLQAFWAQPVSVRQHKPNTPDSTRQLYGLQLARARPARRLTAEAYWLRHEARVASFNGTGGYERRHTIGQRISLSTAAHGGLDADIETAWQTGTVGPGTVRAWMVASQAAWTFAGPRRLRASMGFDAASGDATGGGSVGTFNQLYPLGHAYLGYIDVHGRQNVLAASAGVSGQLTGRTSAVLDLHRFWRASASDALYGVDGAVSRAPGPGLSNLVGTEVDLTFRHPIPGRGLALQGGYGRYWRGPFLLRSGGARRDIDWLYVQATLAL